VQARLWPTPKATVSGPDFARAARAESGGDDLVTAVAREELRPALKPTGDFPPPRAGALNPTWVEWLMGFPLGWTALPPSATPSSRRSQSGSAAASSNTRKGAQGPSGQDKRTSSRGRDRGSDD
jgi:hypothetical protein